MLTQTLRGLERDGLIRREVHQTVPAHVEYELTAMGESVIPLLRNLCHWAKPTPRLATTPAAVSINRRSGCATPAGNYNSLYA